MIEPVQRGLASPFSFRRITKAMGFSRPLPTLNRNSSGEIVWSSWPTIAPTIQLRWPNSLEQKSSSVMIQEGLARGMPSITGCDISALIPPTLWSWSMQTAA